MVVAHAALWGSVDRPTVGHTVIDESGAGVGADRGVVVVAHHQAGPLPAGHCPEGHPVDESPRQAATSVAARQSGPCDLSVLVCLALAPPLCARLFGTCVTPRSTT